MTIRDAREEIIIIKKGLNINKTHTHTHTHVYIICIMVHFVVTYTPKKKFLIKN